MNESAISRIPANQSPIGLLATTLRDHTMVVLAVYFLVQMMVRTLLGAPANLDEAEQLAIADHFAFGYGPHPPLFQWLQTAAFGILGVNFLAIAFVKNAILFGTWAMLALLGRKLTGSAMLAAIGSFGLLFSANFSWESQIDHTHTVSNTFLVVATTFVMFHLLQRQTRFAFVALALCVGLGLVAKYNYALFLLTILVVFVSDPKGRKLIATPAFLLAIVVGLAIAAPHYLYILENPGAGAAKLGNLGINRFGFLQTRLHGLGEFALAAAGVHAVWLAIIGLGWLDQRKAPRPLSGEMPQQTAHARQMFLRLWAMLAIMFLALVLIGGTTSFRDHWLQPEAVFFPLAAAIHFARHIDETAFRRLATAAFILLILIPLTVAGNKRFFPGAQRDSAMPNPAAIATAFPQAASGKVPVVIGETSMRSWYAAGHLRYWLQIPTPRHGAGVAVSTPHLLLFQSDETPPAGSLAIPFFRPQEGQAKTEPAWQALKIGEW